jgi:hypothetical protein
MPIKFAKTWKTNIPRPPNHVLRDENIKGKSSLENQNINHWSTFAHHMYISNLQFSHVEGHQGIRSLLLLPDSEMSHVQEYSKDGCITSLELGQERAAHQKTKTHTHKSSKKICKPRYMKSFQQLHNEFVQIVKFRKNFLLPCTAIHLWISEKICSTTLHRNQSIASRIPRETCIALHRDHQSRNFRKKTAKLWHRNWSVARISENM